MKRPKVKSPPDLTPYEHFPANYPPGFVIFDDEHPEICRQMLQHARKLKSAKRRYVGVKFLLEYERYYGGEREDDPVYFAIDNNFATWFGRKIEAENPDLRGLFRLRRRRGEKCIVDPAQTTLEYD
jgi:hypothetical protein